MPVVFSAMFSASTIISAKGGISAPAVSPYAELARAYDALLGDRFFPQLRRAFEWIVRHYCIRFSSAADVACGTGTFVHYLCQCGVPIVYGVDRSPEMLRVAIRKNLGNGARFLCQDFATLQLPQPVALITCNFDSLNYLIKEADLLRAFCRFHANLKPGGHLIFDMITDRPFWQGPRPYFERVTKPGFTFVRVMRWDPRSGIQRATISISRNGRSHREDHLQRGYPVAMVACLLAQARFVLLGAHDFHTLCPNTRLSTRVVYAAYKALNGGVNS
ncbi:MAG: class I SAM-dependent methyltransferase [candidate division KSB1 bacterium]|nr:class I SAM-dependent methyltransferase [candidate division KSB1 bacterium]MDZ7366251.1 class I SAM-dependent methyltransferase [candidate division KSB1 bacterium]MDZ7404469.1 class I SAM-dependent methyltransferase [candidate division KSB1 bacterium]